MYSGKLPTINDIVWLSTRVKDYPARRTDVVRAARSWGLHSHTVAFLREFPPEYIFISRSNLVHQCELRAQQIRRAWETPSKNKQLSLI